jgi:hypothetical protein
MHIIRQNKRAENDGEKERDKTTDRKERKERIKICSSQGKKKQFKMPKVGVMCLL